MAADAPTAPEISATFFLWREVLEQVAHRRGGLLAFEVEVGADVRVVQARVGVDAAVFEDDHLAGGLRFLEDVVIAGHVERGEDDDVDRWVLVELVERRDLVLELVLRVVELEVDAELRRGLLEGGRVRGAPAALGPGLDEADRRTLPEGLGPRRPSGSVRRPPAPRGRRLSRARRRRSGRSPEPRAAAPPRSTPGAAGPGPGASPGGSRAPSSRRRPGRSPPALHPETEGKIPASSLLVLRVSVCGVRPIGAAPEGARRGYRRTVMSRPGAVPGRWLRRSVVVSGRFQVPSARSSTTAMLGWVTRTERLAAAGDVTVLVRDRQPSGSAAAAST